MRKEGYYWVNPEGRGWTIAKWNGRHWVRGWVGVGESEWFTDEFCMEIDERQIARGEQDCQIDHWNDVAEIARMSFNEGFGFEWGDFIKEGSDLFILVKKQQDNP